MLFSCYLGVIVFLFVFIFNYRNELIHFSFERLGSLFGDTNDIAIFLSFGLVMSCCYFFWCKDIFLKCLLVLIYLIFLYCGFSTGSKIFLLICVVCTIASIFTYFGIKRVWVSFIIVFILSAILVFILNLPMFSTFKIRINSFFSTMFGINSGKTNVYTDHSSLTRLDMFYCGINLFLKKPFFGYGTWGFANFAYYTNGWSHNNFSESLCNFGLVGTILFHLPFAYSVVAYFKHKTKLNHYNSIILLIMIFCMMFSVALNSQKIYALLIAIIVGDFKQPIALFKFDINNFSLKNKRKIGNANC